MTDPNEPYNAAFFEKFIIKLFLPLFYGLLIEIDFIQYEKNKLNFFGTNFYYITLICWIAAVTLRRSLVSFMYGAFSFNSFKMWL